MTDKAKKPELKKPANKPVQKPANQQQQKERSDRFTWKQGDVVFQK